VEKKGRMNAWGGTKTNICISSCRGINAKCDLRKGGKDRTRAGGGERNGREKSYPNTHRRLRPEQRASNGDEATARGREEKDRRIVGGDELARTCGALRPSSSQTSITNCNEGQGTR